MKIATIIGARPQFIKAAVVSRAIRNTKDLTEIIIHTGQHFDGNMSDIFFDEMEIPRPNYKLNINGLGHGAMTGQMLEKIEEVLLKEKPDWVLVYGDTNSTLAGALASKKLHIKVAHVESGLRSFNLKMPEEINRILTDRMSDILFCPTETAVKNLHNEGYKNLGCKIENVGDVMQDAALFYSKKSQRPEYELPNKFVLCTIHRAENTDNAGVFNNIFESLEEIAVEIPVVFPLHPRTRNKLNSLNYNFSFSPITFIEPVGYFQMVWLLQNCQLVMTDSGGLQKEAYFFKKPCLTLREETEWVELVENGYNTICGSDKTKIIASYQNIKTNFQMNFENELYGNGDAGRRIINILKLMENE